MPGDKSITQRAILLAALATGTTRIRGANPGADASAALATVQALGARVRRIGRSGLSIQGGDLVECDRVLDAANSGTTLRLSMGLLAAQPFLSILTGDESLRRRPVDRVIEPLRRLGAEILARDGDRLPPVAVRGRRLHGAREAIPVKSAQVKSAILFAAIQAEGATEIEERVATRDHTERMLPAFGVPVGRKGNRVCVAGPARLQAAEIDIPGDISAAAFVLAAAAIAPGSDVTVRRVGINPTRRAFLDLLGRIGARVDIRVGPEGGAEPYASVRVRAGALEPFHVSAEEAPALIDELPLLAVLAAFARGESDVRGAAELRIKESDRIAAVAAGLRAIGARVEERPDGWTVDGRGTVRGGRVEAGGDHRIAMAFLVAGLGARKGVVVEGAEWARVSDPDFLTRLRSLSR